MKPKTLVFKLCLWSTLFLFSGGVALAAIAQGYKSSEKVVDGTIVGLDNSAANTVQAATIDKVEDLVGVVVSSDSSLISLTNGSNEVSVATSGQANVLVSTVNGDIKAGDKITVSPISGIGMKATLSTKIVGVAQGDFNDKSTGATSHDVKDKSGQTRKVSIGQVPLLVGVAYYVAGSGDQTTPIPKVVQELVNAVAGRSVSPLRIVTSAILLVFTLVAISIILYGSIHSGIISIGRNPLSQSAVYRSILHVILACVGVLLVTLGAVYLIISR
ncbi:MAG TPA: hypothetical protein VLF41_02415 [Candidatus Nanoarchaeia archaeon]|nr:hypothetical protein [Candidatus Nanoarchaeia archaeon]